MNYFVSLPDEKLIEICRKLDTKSLLNLTETNWRFYNVCSEVSRVRCIKLLKNRYGINYSEPDACEFYARIKREKEIEDDAVVAGYRMIEFNMSDGIEIIISNNHKISIEKKYNKDYWGKISYKIYITEFVPPENESILMKLFPDDIRFSREGNPMLRNDEIKIILRDLYRNKIEYEIRRKQEIEKVKPIQQIQDPEIDFPVEPESIQDPEIDFPQIQDLEIEDFLSEEELN